MIGNLFGHGDQPPSAHHIPSNPPTGTPADEKHITIPEVYPEVYPEPSHVDEKHDSHGSHGPQPPVSAEVRALHVKYMSPEDQVNARIARLDHLLDIGNVWRLKHHGESGGPGITQEVHGNAVRDVSAFVSAEIGDDKRSDQETMLQSRNYREHGERMATLQLSQARRKFVNFGKHPSVADFESRRNMYRSKKDIAVNSSLHKELTKSMFKTQKPPGLL